MPDFRYEELANDLGIKGRRSGKQLVGQCPLHNDTKPSFSMNVDDGRWTCFAGCGAGTFPRLVMRVQECTLAEAHDWILASQSLMPVANPIIEEEVHISDAWLHRFLGSGRNVLPQWWFDRGFTWMTAENWDIKYNEDRAQLYIPFYNWNPPGKYLGQPNGANFALMGMVTRNLKDGPKYINSPGLPRSKYLFGQQHYSGDVIYVCEGPLDCIAMAEEGLNSVALLGLKLSDEHVRLLLKFSEVCLSFDNDDAGRDTNQQIANALYGLGYPRKSITRFPVPDGKKDPGECVGQLAELAAHRQPLY